ncbi:MAG: T9SS type A sorting domain-containing protein [Flavobacteriales bacterium]|nr:T9SS type A sorting domain-containing protein [Flavobacteriales bacterium]
MKQLLTLGLLILAVLSGRSQFNLGFDHYSDMKVVHESDTLRFPWAGGLNNPQFSSLDVDLDGAKDIYAYERDGEVTRLFINDGFGAFDVDMNGYKKLPPVGGNFVLMRDYDGDGKQDIFASGYNNYGIDIYRNVSDTSLLFEMASERTKYARQGASSLYFYIPGNDLPSIDDIDGDGDLDILFQGQLEFTPYVLLYIENRSQELFNHSDSLKFKLANPCWGKVREYISQTGWTFYDCDTGYVTTGRGERHGGTTLTTLDLNGDGLKDVITGDSYNEHLISLINIGENVDAVIDLTASDTTFPSYNTPAQVPTLPAAFIEDVDLDGVNDMLVAPNQLTAFASFYLDTSISSLVDWYYHNAGTNTNPQFELSKEGFFSGEMIDVGARSFPVTVDLNGDGLLDLVVGNEGYTIYGGTAAASLTYYKNVGTAEEPVFQLEQKDLAGITQLELGFAHPAFADLDDDGDFDLLVGDDQGRMHYYKNKGVSSIYDFHLNEPMFANIDVDLSAHPYFFDLNQDDLEDLIIGDYYGQFHYYENAGTGTEHDFSQNPTIEKMGDVQTFHAYGGEATPYVTRKLDSLGASLYIMIGSAKGPILVYGPITSIYDDLEVSDSINVDATFTAPFGADLYGDFRHELLIGQRTGGVMAMRRTAEIGVGTPSLRSSLPFEVYPNPSNGELSFSLPKKFDRHATLNITDVSGTLVWNESLQVGDGIISRDLHHLSDGVYLITVRQADEVRQARWVKQ